MLYLTLKYCSCRCSYDSLSIIEWVSSNTTKPEQFVDEGTSTDASEAANGRFADIATIRRARILCGDWSKKVKLLRHVTSSFLVTIVFQSDFAHSFPGYQLKAVVTEREY